MNTIKKLVISFSSLALHALNSLLWKKILSLTLFKIMSIRRPTTLNRVFLTGTSGCLTKGGNLGGLPANPKDSTFAFCWISPPRKNCVPCLSPDHKPYIGEKAISNSLYTNFTKSFPVACSYTIMIYLKKLDGTKSLNTEQCPTGLSPKIIPQVSPFLPKMSPLLMLLCCTHQE